jgi:multiple sugar transport system permease protein
VHSEKRKDVDMLHLNQENRSGKLTRKQRKNLKKTARLTSLYIVIATLVLVLLTPVFFLAITSFMSNREAYTFPLPILPAAKVNLQLETTEKGFMLSILNRKTENYETLLDTKDPEKFSYYTDIYLNLMISEEEAAELFQNTTEAGGILQFKERVNWFNNYRVFFTVTRDAVPALLRSLEIALFTIIISLSIGGMAGYAFARYIFKGKNALKFSVLFVRMFPAVAIAMPMVIILADMGLYDQPLGLSLVYSVGQIGLTVWITASIFMGIPVAFEEAAMVFGSNKFGAFMKITFPLALPGLAACAMYAFLGAWNETVSAVILTQFKPTFAVVVYQTLLGATGQVNLLAAGGLAMALPAVIFTLFIRKYINQMWGGMTI